MLFVTVLALVSLMIERERASVKAQDEREHVRAELGLLRAKLEGALDGPLSASRGLVAALASEPEMGQARYDWLASRIIAPGSGVISLAAARDLKVNLIYPMAGNEAVMGLDYLTTPSQRDMALEVRDTGEFVLAGPLDLVQGGQGLIGRFPVFTERDGVHTFWGLLSVVLDPGVIYSAAGLDDPALDLSVALAGRNGTGEAGALFYGDPSILERDPMRSDVLFPSGSWKLYAIPREGWGSTVEMGGFRLLLGLAAVVASALTIALNLSWVQRLETIAALRRREAELERMRGDLEAQALHDHLTGLPNRRYLERRLTQLVESGFVGLMQLDLDHFKDVNDRAGHVVGDFLLQQVTERLRVAVGPRAFLARSGGDEFVVVCLAVRSQTGQPLSERRCHALLEGTAQRVIRAMTSPFWVNDREFRIGITVGICPSRPGALRSADDYLVLADRALYAAKSMGRNRYAFAAPDARLYDAERIGAEELFGALSRGEIVPYYQLQFGRDGQSVVGAEALARWEHPRHGLLSPREFMPLARTLKVEAEVDRAVLRRVVRDMVAWQRAGLSVPKTSVNVSFQRLSDENLAEEVDTALEIAGVVRDRLAFELLESIFLDDQSAPIAANIAMLKARGIRLEIDDFGTGHASVTSLLRLRPQSFKIDRSLVQAAPGSRENRDLLATIAAMGEALSIEVCAEGIETREQFDLARAVGCSSFQGFLLARPLPAQALAEALSGPEPTNAAADGISRPAP